MFVHVARGAQSAEGILTLTGVAPTTLYFSDRPERVAGHMTNAQFVDQWAVGDNSFASDPPNAVLSFVETGDDRPDDCVVVIRSVARSRRCRLRGCIAATGAATDAAES